MSRDKEAYLLVEDLKKGDEMCTRTSVVLKDKQEQSEKHLLTDLPPGSAPGTMSFKDIYGFELDPEKAKHIDRKKLMMPAVDISRLNDDEYVDAVEKETERRRKEITEYLRQFAKED